MPLQHVWVDTLSDLHQAAYEALRHIALRDLPGAPPDHNVRRAANSSRNEFMRSAARALERHDQLVPIPNKSELARVLAEHALSPTDAPRRFEIYFLMTLAAAIDRIWPSAARRDSLIDPDRTEVIVWSIPDWTLGLRYDHKSPPGNYSRTLRRAFGLSGVLRPDLSLTLKGHGKQAELYLDAKHSNTNRYLRYSATRMLASLIDRPGSFVSPGPCGILLSLRQTDNDPDLDSPLAFIDPSGCADDGPLEHLLRTWLRRCGAPA